MQRAIKEVLTEVPVIGRTILHLGTAVSAVDQTGENAARACSGHTVTLAANLLNLFKQDVYKRQVINLSYITNQDLKRHISNIATTKNEIT